MSSPLAGFPKSVRDAWPFLISGAANRLSSRALESTIRGAGIPISRTSVLQALRFIRGDIGRAAQARFVSDEKRMSESRMGLIKPDAVRQFSYQVELRGVDDARGLRTVRYVTVNSSENLTMGEVKEIAMDFGEDGGTSTQGMTILQAVVVEARRSASRAEWAARG